MKHKQQRHSDGCSGALLKITSVSRRVYKTAVSIKSNTVSYLQHRATEREEGKKKTY